MADKDNFLRIRVPDKKLLDEVKRIAKSPAGDSPEAKQQIETLAQAVDELAAQCADLTSALESFYQSTMFKPL